MSTTSNLPAVPGAFTGKFNVQNANAPTAAPAKAPVHWPYIGFSFANNEARGDDSEFYQHVNSFIDFCGENLEEHWLDMYLEDNAPGVNSKFEQFMRWYFTNVGKMNYVWKRTDDKNAWVIYHIGYTDVLQNAMEFSANGDYTLSVKAMNLALKLVDEFQQFAFKGMSADLYDYLYNNDYFGIAMSRHF